MKGDFSRPPFDPSTRHDTVLVQQGRLTLDSDANDQAAAVFEQRRAQIADIVGASGVPKAAPGFAITVASDKIQIGAGRAYVAGLACENGTPVPLDGQPHLPGDPAKGLEAGTYAAYLDVWSRAVNALQAPAIREVALGGPDTTARLETVWQVRLAPTDGPCAKLQGPGWIPPGVIVGSGTLAVRARQGARLGNNLYLVEIHAPSRHAQGSAQQATYKWSRKNGSVVVGVSSWAANDVVTVSTLGGGLDAALAVADWVELVDDDIELSGTAAPLWQVVAVDAAGMQITLQGGKTPKVDPTKHPLLRRWDQQGSSTAPLVGGAVPLVPGAWDELESGIEIQFSLPTVPPAFVTGDWWAFTTRSATEGVAWPVDPKGQPVHRTKDGIQHAYAPLALLSYDGSSWKVESDCRQIFSPLVTSGGTPPPAADLQRRIEELESKLSAHEARFAALEARMKGSS